ncbi:MAG: ABC transporter ATP-binding protein [Ignavibacteria bacterium]
MKAVEVHELIRKYRNLVALNNISFSVNKGVLFGVIGPDGAGKSTLFRIIATLLTFDAGSVQVAGHDVIKDYKLVRKIIGYMPGRFSLYRDLSVEENLKFFATIYQTTIEKNYYIIEKIFRSLEPFKNRKAGALSGGMQQKLALSCTLIHKPEILLLDEPTTGVDPIARSEFWDILKFLKSLGITTIVSTPYMNEASMCDEIMLINKGNILAVNSPIEMIKSYPSALIRIKPENPRHTLNILEKYKYKKLAYLTGNNIQYCDFRKNVNINELQQFLEQNSVIVNNIEIIPPTIEDCFIYYVHNAY